MLLEAISKLLRLYRELRTWRNVRKSIRVSNMIVDEILAEYKTKKEGVDEGRKG